MVHVLLYALFGTILSVLGVGIAVKPVEFLCLLGILMAVDISSFMEGRRSCGK